MKKKLWKGVIAATFALLASRPATATTISFQPTATTLAIGGSTAVDVIATRGVGEIVSAFDFDLKYDPSIIRATAVSFGNFLGDLNNFEAITDSKLATAGLADFAEVSLLTDLGLANLQSATQFRLATVSFDALAAGTSVLEMINYGVGGNDIKGANNVVLSPILEKGSIAVTGPTTTAPEPSTFILLSIGVLCLAAQRILASVYKT